MLSYTPPSVSVTYSTALACCIDVRVEAQRREHRRECGRRCDGVAHREVRRRDHAQLVLAHLLGQPSAGDEEEHVPGREIGRIEIDARSTREVLQRRIVEQVPVVRSARACPAAFRTGRAHPPMTEETAMERVRRYVVEPVELVRLAPVRGDEGTRDASSADATQQVEFVEQPERLRACASRRGGTRPPEIRRPTLRARSACSPRRSRWPSAPPYGGNPRQPTRRRLGLQHRRYTLNSAKPRLAAPYVVCSRQPRFKKCKRNAP